MNKRNTLSIAPYFGGKGRMAHFIADRLDYTNSDIFVTPFGGMCRVLLNKPRHKVECYNDYSSALCALMRVLSNPEDADILIHRLYDETEYDKGLFEKYKEIYDSAETDLERQAREELRQLLKGVGVSPLVAGSFLDKVILEAYGKIDGIENTPEAFTQTLKNNTDFRSKFEKGLSEWFSLYEQKERDGYLPRPIDMGMDTSDIDLAIATYVVFTQSRDGMGKAWSKQKFKDSEQYKKRILHLYDCAERLEGVSIYQIDAMDFFRRWEQGKDLNSLYYVMNEWISNPDVMIYADPSYIKTESEQRLLQGIDIDNVDSLSEAIKKQYSGKKMPENLGEVYAMSFGYDDQEKFLRCIQNAKCKMMVSNYDLKLYNKYLNRATGWRREEFQTTTSVGGKAGNTRTEVIWYNY